MVIIFSTAWKLHLGAERARLFCEDCLLARFQGDYGYGLQWSEHLYTAMYVGGALQSHAADQGFGFARTSASLILRNGERLGMMLAFEQRFPLEGNQASYGVTGAEARWSIDSRTDLRISYERDKVQQFGLGVGIYW